MRNRSREYSLRRIPAWTASGHDDCLWKPNGCRTDLV